MCGRTDLGPGAPIAFAGRARAAAHSLPV